MIVRSLAFSAVSLIAVSAAWAQTPQVNCPPGQTCPAGTATKPAAGKAPAGAAAAATTPNAAASAAAKGTIAGAGGVKPDDLRGVTGSSTPGQISTATQTPGGGAMPDPKAFSGIRGAPAVDPAVAQADALNGLTPNNRDPGKPGAGVRGSVSLGGGLPTKGSLLMGGKVEVTNVTAGPDGTRIETANKAPDGSTSSFDTYSISAAGGGQYIVHDHATPQANGSWSHERTVSVDGGRTWGDVQRTYVSTSPQAETGWAPHNYRSGPQGGNTNVDPDAGIGHRGPVTCPPLAKNCDPNMLTNVRNEVANGGGPGARPGDTGGASDVPRLRVDVPGTVINPNPVDGAAGGSVGSAPQGARMVDGGKLVNPGKEPD